MEQAKPVVRIVIAQPSVIEGGDVYNTVHALKRLGSDVELEIVRDAGSCIALCRQGAVDLVDSGSTPGATVIITDTDATVASAAPSRPIAGKPNFPNISTQLPNTLHALAIAEATKTIPDLCRP